MNAKSRSTTLSFKIVAYGFLLFGLLSVLNLVLGISNRYLLSFGVLHIFVGIGLLRLKPKSWKWAINVSWLSMAIMATVIILNFLRPRPGYQFKGEYFDILSQGYEIYVFAILFAIFYWAYCVLIHYKTRRLFDQ